MPLHKCSKELSELFYQIAKDRLVVIIAGK